MLSTFAQKFAIPLSFVLSFTSAPAAKVKSIAVEAKRPSVYESNINVSPTQFAMGDISKTLTNFTGSVTALGTDTTTILAGSANGSLNLLHPSGWTEDLTRMLALSPSETARINAVAWNTLDSYWLVGGAVIEKNNSVKPLLVKLMPNGQQSLSLRLEAQKFKTGEVTDIACKEGMCVITAAPGKVLTYNGANLVDLSNRFGFMPLTTPRVASNELMWMIAGVTGDAIDREMFATLYAFDGKNVRLVSPNNERFTMHALPALALASNSQGTSWMAVANDGALHAWVLDGSEFAPLKGFPKDTYLMPVMSGTENAWVLGGGSLAKNFWTIDKAGVMVTGSVPDMKVSAILSTTFGTFVAGSTTLTTGGATPQLIRVK